MITFAQRVKARVGLIISFLVGSLFLVLIRHHPLLALLAGLAIFLTLWVLLAFYLRRSAPKYQESEGEAPHVITLAEGGTFTPPHGSAGLIPVN